MGNINIFVERFTAINSKYYAQVFQSIQYPEQIAYITWINIICLSHEYGIKVANFANCAFTIPFRHLRQRVCPLSWSSKDRGAPHTHIPWDSNCLRLFFWYSSFFWLLLSILSFTNYRIANLKKGVKRAFIPPLKGWVFSPAIL